MVLIMYKYHLEDVEGKNSKVGNLFEFIEKENRKTKQKQTKYSDEGVSYLSCNK